MSGKLIVLGRKKLIWTMVLLVGVMLPLLVASYTVPVVQPSGSAGTMLNYASEKEKFKFKYPGGWLLRTEKYYKGNIKETVSFSSPDGSANGFVQVMELAKSIPDYITESEKSMAPGFDSLQFKQTAAGDKNGYLLAYMRGTGEARSVAAEYFFGNGPTVYRFSCFYPLAQAEQYQKVFAEMLDSFIIPVQEPVSPPKVSS